jgi:hypothetical protein
MLLFDETEKAAGVLERFPPAEWPQAVVSWQAAWDRGKDHPMTDDEQGASGALPRLVQEFADQFREATERLQGLAGLGGYLPAAGTLPTAGALPTGDALPLPGALSAAQMTAIADGIAAQRRSIEALKAQLSSFDEQLAALEQILGPLAEWSRTWAEFEHRLLNLGRRPETES